ncbi:DNA/RNA helicase I, putative [Psychroflexus torquis ATCC 700755]|jgi:superfamily I DNA and RNA helicase|uniref:DNA 3'-5' helicase II n=1 Tax=Psychroflexus torquis (strain ATCC 700755 / CIP 106069 / ACAM 623) TaxID=313595 RepID=K4IQI5_PSYTT|nr:ATP-binding domain-containing protein [Psychroflexus torquis]AFU67755.1 DNA/RNA helicase I, putative [Psychroflexus torquis ATCC 700755]
MEKSLFYSHIKEDDSNKEVIKKFRDYTNQDSQRQIYLINAPLGEKYEYNYSQNVLVILSPKHKIIFLNLTDNTEEFSTYYEDFVEDLSYISDKYNYKEFIGRPREWKKDITVKEKYENLDSVEDLLKQNKLDSQSYRVGELLISLLTSSINDVAKIGAKEPESILEKVKQNIILFDGEQTRFIYQKFANKTVSIQGLSGTGKTELLLHKLKELYITKDKAKIFFTCHNIALANTLRARIPSFFNFMKVEKQIEWNSKLWVNRAWGSQRDINSGLYSYLCYFYNIPFLRYSSSTNYNKIFNQALEHINKLALDNFKFAFDYILIDERQDFPNVFFELCEKVTKEKVFIAGDIFQDIFENTKETELEVDIILNRCYRTDPRTLMFAHSIGLGLFEEKKLNWFDDAYWNALGYDMKREGDGQVELSREPIRRFEELNIENFNSTIIQNSTKVSDVINILNQIKKDHPTVKPEDVGIIILDDNNKIYDYIDKISYAIFNELNWKVNRGVETKEKSDDAVYITNPNNVKGLEFPFVICITYSIKNTYRYRNILYTMLTRSFIQSYLLVQSNERLDILKEGLKTINAERKIITKEPTLEEKEEINNTLVKLQNKKNISYKDFLTEIFDELKIANEFRKKLEKAITQTDIEQFDKDQTKKFINANIEFYS